MPNFEIPLRQIHLDFHTSEAIKNVAKDFNAQEFAATLAQAGVNSVTCFARCHHGWLYYDSHVFPERIHPNLVCKNLLNEQISACHKLGIQVSIYITVQLDQYSAEQHSEWLVMTDKGQWRSLDSSISVSPYEASFYRMLCINTKYREFLKTHIKEILEMFPLDGIFFDILVPTDCSCHSCRSGMEKQGIDPVSIENRALYSAKTVDEFKIEMTDVIRTVNKSCRVFYNGHIGTHLMASAKAYSHLELESLPSGGWGYSHFSIAARYARTLGFDCIGMTGKFHRGWGDFHSFKNVAALEFECFRMLALNAGCSIGDQLHLSGKLCSHTYNLVHDIYSQVEKLEPWCKNSVPLVDIGVFNPEEIAHPSSTPEISPALMGITKILEESQHQFDIIDSRTQFSKYRLIILPDNILISPKLTGLLNDFVASGGKLIASYESGLNIRKEAFTLSSFGIDFKGGSSFDVDFILPELCISSGLAATEHVMYARPMRVEAGAATVLAYSVAPYFNRNYKHFCSHRHTPSSHTKASPAITRNDSCIYFAHPIFTIYNNYAPLWCKRLVLNPISMLLPDPLIRIDGPSTILAAANCQTNPRRSVLHFLHYIPQRRAADLDIIEDVIPLYNLNVSFRTDLPKYIHSIPELKPIGFTYDGSYITFQIPELKGHKMIAVCF